MSLPPIESLTMYKLGYKTWDEIDDKIKPCVKYWYFKDESYFGNEGVEWEASEESRKAAVYKAIYEHWIDNLHFRTSYYDWGVVDDRLKPFLMGHREKWNTYPTRSKEFLVSEAIRRVTANYKAEAEYIATTISGSKRLIRIPYRGKDLGLTDGVDNVLKQYENKRKGHTFLFIFVMIVILIGGICYSMGEEYFLGYLSCLGILFIFVMACACR